MSFILPQGETQFFDANGVPLALGWVTFYIPSTTTFKATYQDQGQTILNTNPIHLDGEGRAVIWGTGTYRQIVQDSLLNTLWDRVVSSSDTPQAIAWGSVGGGTPNAQIVTVSGFTVVDGGTLEYIPGATNTGPTTIAVNLAAPLPVYVNSALGPVTLTGSELTQGNIVRLVYVTTLGGYVIVNTGGNSFNSLTENTAILPSDYAPFFSVADGQNEKILVSNWLKVITSLVERTDPVLADLLFIYNNTDSRMDKITPDDFLKVINVLDEETNPQSDDLLALYSHADDVAKKVQLSKATGIFRYIITKDAANGDDSLAITDLDNFKVIRITLLSVEPTQDDDTLEMQISTDNGAHWIDTDYINPDSGKDDSFWMNDGDGGASNAAKDNGINGEVGLFGTSSGFYTTISGLTSWKLPSDKVANYVVTGVNKTNDPINAVKFFWTGDKFKRGHFYVEGVV